MKAPYVHMNARNVERLDLILLDGLSHCKAPATTDAVIQIADPRGFAQLDVERVIHELTLMIAEGYVERSVAFHEKLAWQITEKGRAHLIACETRSVIEEVARHTPIRPAKTPANPEIRIEEVPAADLNARLRASHKQLDRDGIPPAPVKPTVATVCIDDAELDDWWGALNVQAKAEIFCEYSLVSGEAADMCIPLAGTIGKVVKTQVTDPFQVQAQAKPCTEAYECVTGGDLCRTPR